MKLTAEKVHKYRLVLVSALRSDNVDAICHHSLLESIRALYGLEHALRQCSQSTDMVSDLFSTFGNLPTELKSTADVQIRNILGAMPEGVLKQRFVQELQKVYPAFDPEVSVAQPAWVLDELAKLHGEP